MFAKILLAVSILACASPALAADKRIYKIDSLIATQKDGKVVVQATGAVQTGGWKSPRLRVIQSDGNRTLTIEFLATPPPSSMVVIEALMPVTASAEFKAHGKGSVRVITIANEMTTQILK
jgi:hypothetical protein